MFKKSALLICILLSTPLLDTVAASKYATNPVPADCAEAARTIVLLRWTAGETADSHDVYFGTDEAAVRDATRPDPPFKITQTGTSYLVYGLVPGTTYYWRIDEVEADGTTKWKGKVWSFWVIHYEAYNPSPADCARFVGLNVELSWSPGFDAIWHVLYFSTDPCARPLVYLAPDANYYAPGPLESKTIYYWQVSEIRLEGTTLVEAPGPIWSFKTKDANAPILWLPFDGDTLDYSGYDNHGTAYGNPTFATGIIGSGALDFDGDDYVRMDGVADDITNNDITLSGWVKTTDNSADWFSCNTSTGGNVALWGIDNGQAAMYEDGYQARSTTLVNDGEWHLLTFMRSGSLGTTYVDAVAENTYTANFSFSSDDRWSIGQEWDSDTPSDFLTGTVDDVRIYDRALWSDLIIVLWIQPGPIAWDPKPADGSTPDIEAAMPLTWSPGDDALWHDVYFGTDEAAVRDADTSTTGIYRVRLALGNESYTPGEALEWGRTYYWRIDELEANHHCWINKGMVWSFTVGEYIVVDDFEAYNDLEPSDPNSNRVFETWIDGCGVETNGSIVGYYSIPFCEQNIVHGGGQSMPYFYDNTGGVNYSVAEADIAKLGSDPNWTRDGMKALSLWFYGDPNNDVNERMWVALEDSGLNRAVVTYGINPGDEPNDLRRQEWQEWNIDLADFNDGGVNPADVNSVSIGFGNPSAGGEGLVYFDDIRLYRPRCVASLRKPDSDFSNNCVVDSADIKIMAEEWLVGGGELEADVYEDNKVDFRDYAKLAEGWLEEQLWPAP